MLQKIWNCGFIRPDRSDKTLKYEVRTIQDLVEIILPHFRSYPLVTSKQKDVEYFDQVCCLIHDKQHLECDGFQLIVQTAMKMNPSGKRKYTESEILNSLFSQMNV